MERPPSIMRKGRANIKKRRLKRVAFLIFKLFMLEENSLR